MTSRQEIAHNTAAEEVAAPPAAVYDERRARYAERRDHFSSLSARNGNISLALLFAALACLGAGLWSGSPALLIATPVLGLAFVVSYLVHGRLDQEYRRYAELWSINNEALIRLERNWKELPLHDSSTPDPGHPYAADLDLLGHASLMHLLAIPATPAGQATLRGWLLEPAGPVQVARRQAAVAEMAPLIDLRERLLLRVRQSDITSLPPQRFLAWAEDQDWLARRPWLLWAAWLLPMLVLAALVAQALQLLVFPLWLLLAGAGLILTLSIGGKVDAVLEQASARQSIFSTYADLFAQLTAQRFVAPELQQLQALLTSGKLSADHQMRRLERIMALNDLRRWPPFFLVQILTLANVHLLRLLERWRQTSGVHVRDWIAALGALEALQALAMLTHDHPTWAFPELTADRSASLSAGGLAHPLLSPATRIANDVEVGPPGSLLLITGSNMSGKSTLLRAVGVNVVLAQAGAPVCAAQLTLPPLALATSMRVQDSLEQGVSYFMAELKRLKLVVDAARREREAGQRTLLFLLDEILHGTNTSERQVAVEQVVRHLLALQAMGAISTHDLALAELPQIASVSRLVHFRETVIRGPDGLQMRFDYKLKPGIATSTNALVLVAQVLGDAFASRDGNPTPR